MYRFWMSSENETTTSVFLIIAGLFAPFVAVNYTEGNDSTIVQQIVKRNEQDLEFNYILDNLHENVAILV